MFMYTSDDLSSIATDDVNSIAALNELEIADDMLSLNENSLDANNQHQHANIIDSHRLSCESLNCSLTY